MNKGFQNLISFARGIQNGFPQSNIPLLDEEEARKEYRKVLSRFNMSCDIEQDILNQYLRGELDAWEAIEQLEDETNLSYKEANDKVLAVTSKDDVSFLYSSKKHRKRSKYNGSLVNNTFDDAPQGGSVGGLPTSGAVSSGLMIMSPESAWYTLREESSLKNLKDFVGFCQFMPVGDGVSWGVFTNYGDRVVSHRVIFSGGTYKFQLNDYIDNPCLRVNFPIPIFSMASGEEGTVPQYVLDRFGMAGYDGWVAEGKNVQDGNYFARYIDVGENGLEGENKFYLVFGREKTKSIGESPMGGVYKFRAVYLHRGIKGYARVMDDADLSAVERAIFHGTTLEAIANLGLKEVSVTSPLAWTRAAINSSFLKTHPSLRYLVVSHMMHHSRRHLIKSSLSGTLDTFLYQTYCSGLGSATTGDAIKNTGDNGRVTLSFKSESGHSTNVDLGGNLGTGYVVVQIDDGLGLFPEGTEVGDLLDNDVVQEIICSQGERDRV